ncbi:nucleotidyltransferase domain-containing protein [Lentzea sp. BCCO 10_0798]|uniref:Nucleotidyltransferase domain-containing protein n=1 Tax=Lentzea kristufekii TaxID=3095430 RepID=A0ABU4U813_9PSEU|nr:nucleotidyltransferase domain-containing protein [Lentzea sp. BCCO 10_0798]MDX8056738.1 nucleotidyltransferase domain-containing protein [Lentzea sp. BCCO 10_0798]
MAGDQDEVRHAYGDNMGWRLKGYAKHRSGSPVSEREISRAQFLAIRPFFDAEDNPWLVDLHEVLPPIRPCIEHVLGPLDPDQDYYVTGHPLDWDKDPVQVARDLLDVKYPLARAAFLGGSVAAGTYTANSDLDMVVIVDDLPGAFRETLRYRGWPVELFCHTIESFQDFVARDTEGRRPPLLNMCAEGFLMLDADGTGQRMRSEARVLLDAGPPPATVTELEDRRYGTTDLLEDLIGARDEDERLFVAARLLSCAGELALVMQNRWLGHGKWLLRRLRDAKEDELVDAYRALVRGEGAERFIAVVEAVLVSAGGRLDAGYRRAAPPR